MISLPQFSNDGGFEFNGYDPASFVNAEAEANRADISVRFDYYVSFTDAEMTMYVQEVEAGYSAPGLTALTDTKTYGGTFSLPIGESFSFGAKFDSRIQEQGIETIEWAIFSLVVALLGTLAWKVAGAVTQAGLVEIF